MSCGPPKIRQAASVVVMAPTKLFSSQEKKSGNFPFRVLMLQRNAKTRFFPKSYVFPGGVLDQRADPKDFWKSSLGTEVPEDWPFRICGIRELYEESGLCLTDPKLQLESRKKIHMDASQFHPACQEMNARPQIERLKPFERWITPEQEPRRYDTRFYATRIHHVEELEGIQPDGEEILNTEWISPPEMLLRAKEIHLPPPTWKILRDLSFLGENLKDEDDFTNKHEWFEEFFTNSFHDPIQPTLTFHEPTDPSKKRRLHEVRLNGNRGKIVTTGNDLMYRFVKEDDEQGMTKSRL